MNYKPSPTAWMDFLYGEMDTQEAEQMQQYLAQNPDAQAEWESLQQHREMMQQVQAPEPPHIPNLPIDSAKASTSKWYQNRWLHSVAAGIALMLSAKLIGIQIMWQENTFSIHFGTPESAKPDKDLVDKIAFLEKENLRLQADIKNDSLFQTIYQLGTSIAKLEEQNVSLAKKVNRRSGISEQQLTLLKSDIGEANYQMVLNLLNQSQQYQQAYTQELLGDFSQFLEQQRQQDLQLMEVAFNHIIEQNDLQQEETQYLLTELMSQITD